jgi:hypothetical protein
VTGNRSGRKLPFRPYHHYDDEMGSSGLDYQVWIIRPGLAALSGVALAA